MSKVHQFSFDKSYIEVDINGKIFKVDQSDAAQKKYRKAYKEFEVKNDALMQNMPDFKTATEEELDAHDDRQLEIVAHMVETFLGEGTFPEIYEMAGRSSINMKPLMEYITSLIMSDEDIASAQQYLQNGKK